MSSFGDWEFALLAEEAAKSSSMSMARLVPKSARAEVASLVPRGPVGRWRRSVCAPFERGEGVNGMDGV